MKSDEMLPTLVRELAQEDPDRVVLQHVDGRSHSAREVLDSSMAWAAALEDRGVGRGQTVLVMLPPSFAGIELWLGIASQGAVEVPVNTEYKGSILEHVLADSRAEVAVVAERYLDTFLMAAGTTGLRWQVVVWNDDTTPVGTDLPTSEHSLVRSSTALRPGATPTQVVEPRPRDTSCVLYTSGTTGPSKGVIVPWEQLYATSTGIMPQSELGPDDAFYAPFPPFHVSGKFPFYSMMLCGGRVVIKEQFKTSEFWGEVEEHRCTTTMLLGAMTNFLFRQPPSASDADTPLRNVLMVPTIAEVDEFRDRFDLRVHTVFNMTEVSCPLVSDMWDLGPAGSCGKVRDGYQVRLVDRDDNEVPVGQAGELVVRADEPWALMNGYWGLPEKTVEAWSNLWLHTGDAFIRDADGHYFFVDRIKDAIRRRGENISSVEVESQVLHHPAVAECAVVAVPSEWGEDEILAAVVLRDDLTETELWTFCQKRLPRFMVPRYISFVEAIPKTATSKIRKAVIRDIGVTATTWDAMKGPGSRPQASADKSRA
ncbi:AMP-binding protein [Rhodococcus jostii]|uniref:AMP-binding protein n=1 Tax=Rhodococcus jostii TaxID=132919 RepID=UPI0036291137